MQPPLTFANALVQLKLITSQSVSANFTFTDDELTQALQGAWQDTYACTPVWDSSLTFIPGTWQYALPATVANVRGLYFKRTTSDYPEPISSDLYEVVAGQIQFNNNVRRWLCDNYTIYIKGLNKLALTDSLPSDSLVNYVLWRAAEILLDNLMFKRVFYFLKTDTTLGDITRAKQVVQGNTLRYKQALLREFEAA